LTGKLFNEPPAVKLIDFACVPSLTPLRDPRTTPAGSKSEIFPPAGRSGIELNSPAV
jgi:hypothetical protein